MNSGIWFWVEVILALLVGVLAAANMIAAKQPNAAAAIAKLKPYQAIIGLIALIYSVLFLIGAIDGASIAFQFGAPVLGILLLAMPILAILLGLLFGWALIAKQTGASSASMNNAVGKISSVQAQLGIAEIIVTILLVIWVVGGIAI